MADIFATVEEAPSFVATVESPSTNALLADQERREIVVDEVAAIAIEFLERVMIPQHLQDLLDVDLSDLEDGSVLVYKQNTAKWTSTRLLEQQYIEAGQF